MNHFKGKQFQQDVIIVAVGYYLRYNLSYREVQEILYASLIFSSVFVLSLRTRSRHGQQESYEF
ncbi:hypothetical protein EfmAA96_31940 (plasmid) [Enterococcus faecium]|nr:hypothetical protein EfmAA96_31940 [Enterococcus faecium]